MRKFEISMKVAFKGDPEELKKLEHHVEYFVNLDEYPEIEKVYDVKVEEVKEGEK